MTASWQFPELGQSFGGIYAHQLSDKHAQPTAREMPNYHTVRVFKAGLGVYVTESPEGALFSRPRLEDPTVVWHGRNLLSTGVRWEGSEVSFERTLC